ncbi:hypothetical protein [Carnimonas bestiolae]|uniref:hypothetical protein n=1 Tax=Carnimonas bestiolae TaxID=3402172 RepID=UPI003F4A9BE6
MAVLEMVMAGLGWAELPREPVALYGDNSLIELPVSGRSRSLQSDAVRRRDTTLGPAGLWWLDAFKALESTQRKPSRRQAHCRLALHLGKPPRRFSKRVSKLDNGAHLSLRRCHSSNGSADTTRCRAGFRTFERSWKSRSTISTIFVWKQNSTILR